MTKEERLAHKIGDTSMALEHLFGSRTRVQLLQTFLKQPERAFYVRELSRQIGSQINAVRRELDGLGRDNFIVRVEKKDEKRNSSTEKKYFAINKNFVLFPELKALFSKSHLFLENDFVRALESTKGVSLLILTGRFMNSENTETDILIVGSINRNKVQEIIRDFEKNMGFEINYTLMETDEYKYRKEICDQFLLRVMNGKNIIAINNL